MTEPSSKFTFGISLSVLNHLGRNLYRSFMTVLGEAISNSWDADAENVWIYIDKEKAFLVVKDDGVGMSDEDFQNKFLKIGYSKRKDDAIRTKNGRPFIGRKGIGKLALLSCSRRISIQTRKSADDRYIGGSVDNPDLDDAIKDDLEFGQYHLPPVDESAFHSYMRGHKQGTIIYFEDIAEGIRNRIDYLRKQLALYFRFSLLDESFKLYVEDKAITLDDLSDLAESTEFLWRINDLDDPYICQKLKASSLKEQDDIHVDGSLKGFIASVKKPRNLKIFTTEERIGVDLFVNGRLREKDILRRIPKARVYESYLYGQIHFDELDDANDRFTSNREGIRADDPKFNYLLKILENDVMPQIDRQWDEWRVKHRQEGDSENKRIPRKERKSRELFNIISEEYSLPEKSARKGKVDGWVHALAEDAQFNFSSYADCFVSENLLRTYIEDKNIALSREAEERRDIWKTAEDRNQKKANISIDIRRSSSDLSYLSMDDLANLVDKVREPQKQAGLSRDAAEYKPMRDALAHTALLTKQAKNRLNDVYENIKARIRTLLSQP